MPTPQVRYVQLIQKLDRIHEQVNYMFEAYHGALKSERRDVEMFHFHAELANMYREALARRSSGRASGAHQVSTDTLKERLQLEESLSRRHEERAVQCKELKSTMQKLSVDNDAADQEIQTLLEEEDPNGGALALMRYSR